LYIWDNYKYLQRFIKEHLPQLVLSDLQGTYLAWVDFTHLKLSPEELELLIQKKAKLLFSQGYIFGEGGAGFQRINIACPRKVLELGLGRLKTAIDRLNGE
jgi:bifunctional pyridoxal-dependent enzyme with beta-cystathionase and maltose regulon repressor activities